MRGRRHGSVGGGSIDTIFPYVHEVGCRIRRLQGVVEAGFENFDLDGLWTRRFVYAHAHPDNSYTAGQL